jgi:acyl transferase domain-containing protein
MNTLEGALTALSSEARELLKKLLKVQDDTPREPIAIVGIGCRFPGGAHDPDTFWQLVAEGRDAITGVPRTRWGANRPAHAAEGGGLETHARWGGFLDQVDQFDPGFFGISHQEAVVMDPQQRLLMEVACEALEDAGEPFDALEGSATAVYVGITTSDFATLDFGWLTGKSTSLHSYTGISHAIAANRLSYFFNLNGPSMALDTTCSSSLVAVHLACQALRGGECTRALAGGVNVMLAPIVPMALAHSALLANDGRCKAFDAAANGMVRGEGCGVIVLKRLSDALANTDRIYALIRGSAINQDGRTLGISAPSGSAQQAVIREALKRAGVSAADVHYVEAHGSGTALGDSIEMEALASVYGAKGPSPCGVASVKANMGHLEAAAGIAGLIKTSLMLERATIAPHVNFQKLNPYIALESTRMTIPLSLQRWPDTGIRRAGVSAFGFGGTNAHVVLEQPPADAHSKPQSAATDMPLLLPISGRNAIAARANAAVYRQWLSRPDSADCRIDAICQTASCRRTHYEHRLGVVASNREGFLAILDAFLTGTDDGRHCRFGKAEGASRVVYVMGDTMPAWVGHDATGLMLHPGFASALSDCEAAFLETSGTSVLEALAQWPSSSSDTPVVAQAVLFSLQVSLARLWMALDIRPAAIVGWGTGAVAAACIAGAFSLRESVHIVGHGPLGRRVLTESNQGPTVPLFSSAGELVDSSGSDEVYWQRILGGPADPGRIMRALAKFDASVFLEFGQPGVLTSDASDNVAKSVRSFLASDISDSLARFFVLGFPIRWAQLYPTASRPVRLPTYQWQRQRYWPTGEVPAGTGVETLEARVIPAHDPPVMDPHRSRDAIHVPAVSERHAALDRLANLSGEARRAVIQQQVRTTIAAILNMPSPESIDAARSFFELGIDSLSALEIKNRLEADLGCAVSASALFEHADLASLSDHLAEQVSATSVESTAPLPVPGEPMRMADRQDLLRRVSELSAEEVDALLAQAIHSDERRGPR